MFETYNAARLSWKVLLQSHTLCVADRNLSKRKVWAPVRHSASRIVLQTWQTQCGWITSLVQKVVCAKTHPVFQFRMARNKLSPIAPLPIVISNLCDRVSKVAILLLLRREWCPKMLSCFWLVSRQGYLFLIFPCDAASHRWWNPAISVRVLTPVWEMMLFSGGWHEKYSKSSRLIYKDSKSAMLRRTWVHRTVLWLQLHSAPKSTRDGFSTTETHPFVNRKEAHLGNLLCNGGCSSIWKDSKTCEGYVDGNNCTYLIIVYFEFFRAKYNSSNKWTLYFWVKLE